LYTIILGGGLIGTGIAKWIIEAGAEVTIIEMISGKVDLINASLGDVAICGDALRISDLERSGIVRADSFIATTSRDDINLMACQIAKEKYGIETTISLVVNPGSDNFFKMLGVTTTLNITNTIIEGIASTTAKLFVEEV
tara:strand:- start:1736 stop:2155 length:420 start_codon:yes stop_codon:yes gene_type:complete